jgi:hypothetical protein
MSRAGKHEPSEGIKAMLPRPPRFLSILCFCLAGLLLLPGCAGGNRPPVDYNAIAAAYYAQTNNVENVSIKLTGATSKISLEGPMEIAVRSYTPPKSMIPQGEAGSQLVSGALSAVKFVAGMYFGRDMFNSAIAGASKAPVVVEQQVPFFVPTPATP